MGKRKDAASPSLRWSVFARDGFTCRYCGRQGGVNGVELHADHVLSVAEGGATTFDNLVTACQECNGGKGARSLAQAPAAKEVIERIELGTRSLKEQSRAMAHAIVARRDRKQLIVNMKCQAYGVHSTRLENGEETSVAKLCHEFGADVVLEWYHSAAQQVPQQTALRYVRGCAKIQRERAAL